MALIFAPSPEHTVSIVEHPLPELAGAELGDFLAKVLTGELPAFVLRHTDTNNPRELHASRYQALTGLVSMESGGSTELTATRPEGPFHYDGEYLTGQLSLHTTLQGGGRALFTRAGPDHQQTVRAIELHDEMALDSFDTEAVPSRNKLFDVMGDLLNAGQTDTRMCEPDFYVTHLYAGDSVIFETKRSRDVWHRFDTDTDPDRPRVALIEDIRFPGR